MQSYAYRKKEKLQFKYHLLQTGKVPLGRFLNEESAVSRVKFNIILKNLKIFFKILFSKLI